MGPHTSSATPEQIDALLNYLDKHRDLARGRMRSVEGKVQAKRLWKEMCNMLNSMGGCTKTVQQWQKVWFDRKHLAKKAAADSRRSASMTGSGPSTALLLSQLELKALSIIEDRFGECQNEPRVPALSETNELSTISPASQPPSVSDPLNLDLPEEVVEYIKPSPEDSQPRQLTEPVSPLVSQNSVTSRRCARPTRPGRRQSAASSDIRSRLFQFEEERAERETVRNTELAGIKAALLQLCGLVREYLDHKD